MAWLVARAQPAVWIILLWSVAALPNLSVRSFIWEEGTNAELARDIVRRGDWLEPAVYGVRWVEPALLPRLIAATARLTGAVNEWSARLPAMLAVLCTALLVERLTRRYASGPAALFAALSFLFCPLLLQKLTIAEPDTVVTFFSFAAFVVWWRGEEAGHVSGWRWLSCGTLLAILTIGKGPQPAAFFTLGVGAYHLYRRRWPGPGLVLCLGLPFAAIIAWAAAIHRPGDLSYWLRYMRLGGDLSDWHRFIRRFNFGEYLGEQAWFAGRLLLELLPGTMLLPFLFELQRRRQPVQRDDLRRRSQPARLRARDELPRPRAA